jgi:acetyl esterase
MALDAVIQAMCDAAPTGPMPDPSRDGVRDLTTKAMDDLFLRTGQFGPDVARVVEYTIPVAEGIIDVRVYTPPGQQGSGPWPGHVYFHGGAWAMGNMRNLYFDSKCRFRCVRAGCVVVSVDYRLAPEHKAPTAAEDCYAALLWTAQNAQALNIDTSMLSIGGDSAGGNLAAVVALMARDRNGPAVMFQLLEVPAVDLTLSHPTIAEFGDGYYLSKAMMQSAADYYLADPSQASDPYVSPLFASDLSGLPPAYVMTAEFDPLRDEGEAYAARLSEAGVAVGVYRGLGHIHGAQMLTGVWEPARKWAADADDALAVAIASARL